MTLVVLDDAELELRQAAQWYENRRSGLGEELINEVNRAFSKIEGDLQRFPISDESPANVEIRECQVARFPYIIYFEIRQETIWVLAIAHGGRRPGYWTRRIRK